MELKRILYQRKTIFLFFAFFLFHIVFFIYSQQSRKEQLLGISRYQIDCCKSDIINEYKGKDIGETEKELNQCMAQLQILMYSSESEQRGGAYYKNYSLDTYFCAMQEVIDQLSYVETFKDSVDEVLNQADSMNTISIFSNQDSFSSQNLEKTKKDYINLKNVEPVFFPNSFLENFFTYTPVHYISVLCGFIFVIGLCEEKKKGLKSLIFSTYSGRRKLMISKIAALFLLSVCATVLLYGITIIVSMLFYQKGLTAECFAYPIQSLELFSSFTHRMSIGFFLLFYIGVRCFIVFVVALLLLFLLSAIETNIASFGIMAVVVIVEYLFYALIGSNNPANLLKYVNLFHCIGGAELFTEYKNLNLFSMAVGKNTCIMIASGILFWLLLLFSFLVNQYKYPVSTPLRINRTAKTVFKSFMELYYRVIERFSVRGMEYYKILFCQKGIFVLLVLFVTIGYCSDFSKVIFSGSQELMMEFLENYEGVPSEESDTYIKNLDSMIHILYEEYEQAVEAYEKGDIDAEQFMTATLKYDAFAPERQLLEQLNIKTQYLKDLKEEKNIKGWYVNEYGYIHLIGNEKSENIQMVLVAIGIVLLCSGIFAFERKNGIEYTLRATEWGRDLLFWKKIKIVFGMALFLYLITTAYEFATVLLVYGLSGFDAPVQSLQFLSFIPFHCSVGVFVICIYVLKLFMMLVIAGFTCMLSTVFSQKIAILLSAVLYIPTFLYLAGINLFRYFSIIGVIRITPLLLESQNVWISMFVICAFVAIGVISILFAHKKWCHTTDS